MYLRDVVSRCVFFEWTKLRQECESAPEGPSRRGVPRFLPSCLGAQGFLLHSLNSEKKHGYSPEN